MSQQPRKLANIRPKEAIRALERAGWFIHESSGSHVQLKHPKKPGRITIPYHSRFDLPKHILKSIINQAGLTNKQFFELLKK
jgi:predicted RNA binding protein YcfA (HicA-like mRNA interferase family)